MNTPTTLILASNSPRRRDILNSHSIPFQIVVASIDETPFENEDPLDYALRMAKEKSQKTKLTNPQIKKALYLSADTIVVLKGRVFGKPKSEKEACDFLQQLQGQCHEVITAFALLSSDTDEMILDHDVSWVTIKTLSPERIETYVKTGEPMDKAGAYAAQGLGSRLIEKIEGSTHNVIGLPIEKIIPYLEKVHLVPAVLK